MFAERSCISIAISRVIAVLYLSAAAWAQSSEAEIAGMVKDPSGGPVSAARLSLTNQDSGVTRAVISPR